MPDLDLRALIQRLNDVCHRSLDNAAGLTTSRTHYNVEIEHWLIKLLEMQDCELRPMMQHFEVEVDRLSRDLTAVIDKIKSGNSRRATLSPALIDLMKEAWLIGSVDYDATQIRSGHLLLALLSSRSLSQQMKDASREFAKIKLEDLKNSFLELIKDSKEAISERAPLRAPEGKEVRPGETSTKALDQFTLDLTSQAQAGAIDPVLGRDSEIRQVIDILTRRRQNNPILTGEAGVGKTAVVEGFARRIAAGDVPPPLKNVSLRSLDLGLLQAGASVKGEFENRLKEVIKEVKASPRPIIVFIDEAHTLIGAGGQAGQGDAANLLKPALARGEFRTIAATTWAEYKKYFEKDPALTRRFQVIKIEEPTEAVAIDMMRGLARTLEQHHKVQVLDEAIEAAVKLSHRYIMGRQLPDKSVSLLDTACARVSLSQTATPSAVEDCRRRLEHLDTELAIYEREQLTGENRDKKIAEVQREQSETQDQLTALEERWGSELKLAEQVLEVRQKLENSQSESQPSGPSEGSDGGIKADVDYSATNANKQELRASLDRLNEELATLQGEQPLVKICVDEPAVSTVVANWTGIPVGRMMTDEIRSVLTLQERMAAKVVGQPHALEAIAESIVVSRAKLMDPNRPIGVFLMVGTSGVGKTETALSLAEILYGGRDSLTVINMSEFKEEHKISTLMGAPPGYVGYGEGGILTEAVRRRPYSVVLLDEMEKAHPGVQDVFYQVFDKGVLRDSEGRDVDFKNSVIIMTSNAGTEVIHQLCEDPGNLPDVARLSESLRPSLLDYFKPAFLGRVSVVPYFPLSSEVLKKIAVIQLDRIKQRVLEHYDAEFTYGLGLVDNIVARCSEVESGARNIHHILDQGLLPQLSSEFLALMAEGTQINSVTVDLGKSGGYEFDIA